MFALDLFNTQYERALKEGAVDKVISEGVVTRTGTDERLNEFAPAAGGGSGDYFQALASAWYNGAFDTGSLEKGIKSKEDVERLLNRGIVAPDGKIRKYAIDYNSDFDGVVISSDDYYEHADYNDQGQEVDSRNGRPWGPYDYMEFDDEELDESAKYRDPKYKGQLYTQEPPDYNDTREYDNARFNPKPKGYPGRKELPGGGEYNRTDPLRRGQGIGRSGIKNNINLSGKRKGLPSRDQITSLKGSIKDAHGTHTRPNLPEQGEVTKTATGLKHRATDKYGAGNDEPHYYTGGRSGFSDPGKYARDLEHVNKQLVKDLDASMGISWKNRGTKGVEVDEQGVAEGMVKGEYGRVLDALQLYYPRLSMDELNVPGYHKVVADKANVPVEYAAQVINDFTRDNDPDEDEFDDDEQGMAEGGSRYDDNRTGFGRDNTFRNQERNAGLENEQNNIQISINGKPWKVVPGKGYADSAEERAYLNGMRRWAEKKSTSSGKKWTVSLTGANPTVNELSTEKLAQYKTAAALDAGAADKRGDFERGNKRFSGIVKATKKQFANDVKKHKPIQPTVKDSLEEIDRRGFLRGLGAAAIGAVGVGAAGSAQARSSDASRKEDDEALALLAKGMTPEQVAKKLGVQGPNHGQTHQMGGQWASINRAAAQLRRQQQGTQGLNEFAPGAGGDDEAGDDPYKYPKPKRYNRSADFFGQFEADHFDREDFDDATGVFKGYWGNTQIAYFKFDNPAQTGGNNPGMGWYYEPESNGNSDTTSTKPGVNNSEQRKQQELGMIRAFLKSGNRPNPDSQIGRLMKKHGIAEGSSTASDAVERAILNRIMIAHTDLLMKFGPDKVMQAAEEVAYNVGDVDEIGTSDVSAYVNQVRQILGA